MQSEVELLEGAKTFEVDILGVIYDRYSPRIYAYALRLLGDPNLAEDCVAETFARFLHRLRAGQGPDDHLQAYLYRVAHNWITDLYRRKTLLAFELDENLCADDETQPEQQANLRLERQRIRGALRILTPDQRQVIILRFLEGWENEEVAAAVQKPIGAVKALQYRALASLRRWLLREEKEGNYAYEYGHG